MTRITIALVGRAGAGKDTAADILVNRFNKKKVFRAGFADAIKQQMSDLFNTPLDVFYNRTLKEQVHKNMYGRSPREICQWFGTDVMRNTFDKDFWYKHMILKIQKHGCDVNIITDCRFLNEAVKLRRDCNAYILYIDADERIGQLPDDSHESEKEVYLIKDTLKDVITIDNNSDLKTFTENINNVIKYF